MKLINDLCKGKDGSWSLTKIAAVIAHTMLSFAFAKITLATGFIPDMWLIYGSFAIGHAIADKVSAQVKDFKEQRLTAENGPTNVRDPASQDPAV